MSFLKKVEIRNYLDSEKNSSGYVDVCCLYTFLKVKFAKKGAYILIRSNCPATENYVTELCTQSEGGTDYIRVYFQAHLIWNLCQSTSMRHFQLL